MIKDLVWGYHGEAVKILIFAAAGLPTRSAVGFLLRSFIMFQTFISRHNSNFFSDKLVLTSVTPASSPPVLQTPKATSQTLYFLSLTVDAGIGGCVHCVQLAQLRVGIVAVLEEHAVVELFRARGIERRRCRRPQRAGRQEFVEEQSAQGFRRSRVAREEGALHDFGKIHEREDGTVEIREVRREGRPLLWAELIGHPQSILTERPEQRHHGHGRRDRHEEADAARGYEGHDDGAPV